MRGVAINHWGKFVLIAVLAVSAMAMLLTSNGAADHDVADHPPDPLVFQWSPEEQRQRELAIEMRDRSLLPECTQRYFDWREATKAEREALGTTNPPSANFWSKAGCKEVPDRVERGLKSKPGIPSNSPY